MLLELNVDFNLSTNEPITSESFTGVVVEDFGLLAASEERSSPGGSLTKMYPNQLARILIVAFALPWYLGKMGLAVSFGSWMLFLILIILAVTAFYNLYFIIASLSFWLQNIFNLNDLFAEILDVGKRTTDIFTGVAGGAILFVIPVGLIATIPAKVLMGTAGWEILPLLLLSNLILFVISRKFFRFAIRFYSSASS